MEKNLSNLIKRHFTKDMKTKSVFDMFNWKKVSVKMTDYRSGEVLFEKNDLEFPTHYSQTSCDIIASRYFRRAGVNTELGYEYSMKEVAHRLVTFWIASAMDAKLITKAESKIVYDELVYMFLNQMWAPNSPQWFNTGLKLAYGIESGSEGNFYYDEKEKKVKVSEDAYTRTSGSACFIISIEDKLLGHKSLSEQVVTETRLFKQGAGTGTNFSTIRAEGEKLNGGGTSSGLMSFLRVFDRNAGAIKSGGTTRRAAKLVTLNADHPEILKYIDWKMEEEDKVRQLIKMGYDYTEAYDTVAGQNSNNSIRFSNELMKLISEDDGSNKFTLKGRIDDAVNKEILVSELWDRFNKASHSCGDPAPQFDDIANEWHTCPAGEDGEVWAPHNRINASNPCSEFFFLDDSACNLASINILKFYDTNKEEFDIEGLLQAVTLIQIVLEATIHWGQFPTEDIARKSHMFRPTGLGIANSASLNMVMGHPYDSDEARTVTSTLMGIITGHSYYTSALMAEKIGTFEKYEINKEHMLKVMRNHARIAGAKKGKFEGLTYEPIKVNHDILKISGNEEIGKTLIETWNNAVKAGEEFGYRNAQTTVIAPTGTIAFAMDCGSTSTEPFFAHVIWKKLSDGGGIEIVNPMIEISLKKLGYEDYQIKDIVDYILRRDENGMLVDGKIEGAPHLKAEHLNIFDTANKCGTGERYISPMGHIKMVASLTPLISGAISKTVNLPSDATIEDFKKVHIDAWRLGTKAIALYRDGCKAVQPLNTRKEDLKSEDLENLSYKDLLEYAKTSSEKKVEAPKRNRPDGMRQARTHEGQIDGLKLFVNVTFYSDGTIAEVYLNADREGSIIKGTLDSLSKMISKMLQYNVPVDDIIKTLKGQKYEPHGFVDGHPYIKFADSISDFIAKILQIETGNFSSCQVKPKVGEFVTIKEMLGYEYILKEEIQDANNIQKEHQNLDDTNSEKVYGKTCSKCGSTNMRKNGTCYVCADCGETTGCS